MNSQGTLVVNASYKDLFSNQSNIREDSFIFPKLNDLDGMENSVLTRSVALLMKNIDDKDDVKYGVEIKSNGSERSSRIPLVRITTKTASIWKIVSNLSSLEKSAVILNDLYYFLKDHSDGKYVLPKKVILLKDSTFVSGNLDYTDFVKSIADTNNIIIISFDFLKDKIKSNDKINFEYILDDSHKRVILN